MGEELNDLLGPTHPLGHRRMDDRIFACPHNYVERQGSTWRCVNPSCRTEFAPVVKEKA